VQLSYTGTDGKILVKVQDTSVLVKSTRAGGLGFYYFFLKRTGRRPIKKKGSPTQTLYNGVLLLYRTKAVTSGTEHQENQSTLESRA